MGDSYEVRALFRTQHPDRSIAPATTHVQVSQPGYTSTPVGFRIFKNGKAIFTAYPPFKSKAEAEERIKSLGTTSRMDACLAAADALHAKADALARVDTHEYEEEIQALLKQKPDYGYGAAKSIVEYRHQSGPRKTTQEYQAERIGRHLASNRIRRR